MRLRSVGREDSPSRLLRELTAVSDAT